MINPAKYYNPKLIPVLGACLCLFLLLWIQEHVSMNVVMGYFVALKWAKIVQGDENGNWNIFFNISFFWPPKLKAVNDLTNIF